MLAIPRHLFVPASIRELAYRDSPLSIGHNQTISQPSTVITMTEALDVSPGQKILEIGAGSGWQAALLAKLVSHGHVWTVERIKELVEFAKRNLEKAGIKNVTVIHGDGSAGLRRHAPYDRIIVTAACPDVPGPLLEQLKVGGKMVIPVGNVYLQRMIVLSKGAEKIERREIGNFMFVPLIGQHGFKG
jgi:protein-L-isoaspartate(D-aspartate) O-methyltransferase